MYDSIFVKQKLPLPKEVSNLDIDWELLEFQTKSLDNCLLEYTIHEDGSLSEKIVEKEYVEWTDEDRKNRKIHPWNLWKDIIEKNSRQEILKFHGVIRFYCYEKLDEENNFSLDFDAYFIYGKLDKIQFIEYKTFNSNKNEYFKELIEERKKLKFKVKRFFAKFSGWNFFWTLVQKSIHKIINLLEKVRVFIFNYLIF